MACNIERNLIFVETNLKTKEEVVRFLGEQLVKVGAVLPPYIESMMKREEEFGTYITEGIAIPHGTEDGRNYVLKSAISVLRLPHGVEWGEEKKVYLAFGIAGKDDEHVELLSKLATMLLDDELRLKLLSSQSVEELFNYLTEGLNKN